ncbi:PREDICTED: intraflagellar transport protein 74 homolog [Priapulus caudatus]|uniref:Intraflagellar transport protein 74 homolog n=1 Tax=Priapulus caudatus TaxID=37621 RepID=A0ABM1EDT1_PRICU|nr:PREDICTED: intraflagellar transport protein 74 homolog [Priapulus caudatus]
MSRPPSAAGRRPGTGTGQLRPPTAMRPGTASRLAHAMAATPGTGRPGTRGSTGAMGTSLNTEIQVMDRPTTQQGLGGIKTGYKGPHRQIQDKSYFLGLMRSKINELGTEINRLQNETDRLQQENSQFLLYEKKAEVLAQEIKDMQGELIDHNTLVDKLNTDMSVNMVQDDYNHLKQQNDREAKSIDMIFTERQEKEKKQQELEKEMEQERQLADTLVAHMDEDTRRRHLEMKSRNNDQLAELERQQRQLDEMNARRADLEDEISVSHIKQEAVNQLSQAYVQRRTQLEDNETYLQLQNLEKKWQHYEQNNYVMKEFIGNKMRETDYSVVKHSVLEQLQRYNKHIIDNAGKPGKAMSTMSETSERVPNRTYSPARSTKVEYLFSEEISCSRTFSPRELVLARGVGARIALVVKLVPDASADTPATRAVSVGDVFAHLETSTVAIYAGTARDAFGENVPFLKIRPFEDDRAARERSRVAAAELQDLETELDEQHGERNVKYRELRKREETMDEFMTGFEDERTGEMERKLQLEINILALLEQMARNLSKLGHVPSRDQLAELRADLTFKVRRGRDPERSMRGRACTH